MALPRRLTLPLRRGAVLGGSKLTWNLGRLYSSTLTFVIPNSWPSVRIVIRPIKRSRGAVKLPLKEP